MVSVYTVLLLRGSRFRGLRLVVLLDGLDEIGLRGQSAAPLDLPFRRELVQLVNVQGFVIVGLGCSGSGSGATRLLPLSDFFGHAAIDEVPG